MLIKFRVVSNLETNKGFDRRCSILKNRGFSAIFWLKTAFFGLAGNIAEKNHI
jgi:hypothetical protein